MELEAEAEGFDDDFKVAFLRNKLLHDKGSCYFVLENKTEDIQGIERRFWETILSQKRAKGFSWG